MDPATVGPEARLADLHVDSLDVLEAAVVIEQRYGVAIPEETFATLDTVGDLVALIDPPHPNGGPAS